MNARISGTASAASMRDAAEGFRRDAANTSKPVPSDLGASPPWGAGAVQPQRAAAAAASSIAAILLIILILIYLDFRLFFPVDQLNSPERAGMLCASSDANSDAAGEARL